MNSGCVMRVVRYVTVRKGAAGQSAQSHEQSRRPITTSRK